jgi:hypothetical protein
VATIIAAAVLVSSSSPQPCRRRRHHRRCRGCGHGEVAHTAAGCTATRRVQVRGHGEVARNCEAQGNMGARKCHHLLILVTHHCRRRVVAVGGGAMVGPRGRGSLEHGEWDCKRGSEPRSSITESRRIFVATKIRRNSVILRGTLWISTISRNS